jgi:hypothetical protein
LISEFVSFCLGVHRSFDFSGALEFGSLFCGVLEFWILLLGVPNFLNLFGRGSRVRELCYWSAPKFWSFVLGCSEV